MRQIRHVYQIRKNEQNEKSNTNHTISFNLCDLSLFGRKKKIRLDFIKATF